MQIFIVKKIDFKKALKILNSRLKRFKKKQEEKEVHQEALKKEVELIEKESVIKRIRKRYV